MVHGIQTLRPNGRIRITVSIFVAVLLLAVCSAFAEDTIEYNCKKDFSVYAQTVAGLNNRIGMRGKSKDASGGVYAVLCQTDGSEVDVQDCTYRVSGPDGRYTFYFADGDAADAAMKTLCRQKGVRYAERDSDVWACSSDGGTVDFLSWGAEEMDYGDYAPYTQTWMSGTGVTVAIVDSGVALHPDLQERIVYGGSDFVDGDSDPTNDAYGHGTNVAGIVVDCTPNLPVGIMPIRVLNAAGGGRMSNVVNGVTEARIKHADVINLSLQSSIMSEALDAAIQDAVAAGITVVVAAGNSGTDTVNVCPAHLTDMGVIVVGSACKVNGGVAKVSNSNYGASVDVFAFGDHIECCSIDGGYCINSGTSMATPHISALCAMLQLLHPGISPEAQESRIRTAAGLGSVNIPNLAIMIPQSEEMYLNKLTLEVGTELRLPVSAVPLTACERIEVTSADDTVVTAENGLLTAVSEGTCLVMVRCTGFGDMIFPVTVIEASSAGTLTFPEGISSIGDEAMAGNGSITRVILPETLEHLGDDAFADCSALHSVVIPDVLTDLGSNDFSDAVLFCGAGTPAAAYAQERGLNYISTDRPESDS